MSSKVTVIGDGGWGTALALVLHRNGHQVTVWGPFADYIEEIRTSGENTKFLAGVPTPPDLKWTADPDEAVDGTEAVVLAMPTKFFRQTVSGFAGRIGKEIPTVSVAKGFDVDTRQRMSEVACEVLDHPDVAALSGPSHAEEVALAKPTAVVLAARHSAQKLQELFASKTFRVYTTDDVTGVELGGAMKNVVAIAAGVCDGLGFGDNTKAALITRGLAEMTRLGTALGARQETFSGLSGMGDLIVTCGSRHSRNRSVGERLGRGETMQQILDSTQQAVEGVWNCKIVSEISAERGVETPIADEVCAIVHQGKDPLRAVEDLLSREHREE